MTRALALSMLADGLFGDPRRLHPVAGFGTVAAALERRLWRPSRRVGAVYTAALVGAAALVCHRAPGAFVLWSALGGRSLVHEALALADAVARGDLAAARRRAPALVGRDPSALDEPELCRAAVESVAENTADAVIAPLLWFALAGPAGAGAYRAANTLDAMVGHRSEHYEERFGWAAARLDDALTWPAARLGALLVVLLGDDPAAAWQTLLRDGRAHPSPNAGQLEAAFAGALGLRLGGANRYDERVEHRPHLGDGRPPEPRDVVRAARLSQRVGWVAAALCAAWSAR